MVEELYTPEQLDHMHQQLWECVLQFANFSATQERNRIARDLHDSLGYALTALNFQLQTAMKLCKPDPNQAQEFLTEAYRLAAIATQEVRQSVKVLRSDAIETQSVEASLELLVRDFQQTTGISPEVEVSLPIPLSPQFVTPICRVIQEALNNICKYAQATAVQICIRTDTKGVYFAIQDNGRGFDPKYISGGYGLQGMRERVAMLQGHLQLEAQPGHGCCIKVDIPTQVSRISQTYLPAEMPIQVSEISISQEYSTINRRQTVTIGEWQLLNLN